MAVNAETLARLRRLAEGATPGPWKHDLQPMPAAALEGHLQAVESAESADVLYAFTQADAQYLAACDPQTVLAIVAEIERLRLVLADARDLKEAPMNREENVSRLAIEIRQALMDDDGRARCSVGEAEACLEAYLLEMYRKTLTTTVCEDTKSEVVLDARVEQLSDDMEVRVETRTWVGSLRVRRGLDPDFERLEERNRKELWEVVIRPVVRP